MQVSKLLVIALVCVVLISGGAEMSAGAAAVPRALLRANVLPAALPHARAAAAVGVDRRDPPGCCHPLPNCCVHVVDDDNAAPAASDDSP
jgi:hypothetical protein